MYTGTNQGLSQECKGGLTCEKSISITNTHIIGTEDKDHMIITIDSGKNVWQNFHDKNTQQMKNRRNFPQPDKVYLWKAHCKINIYCWKTERFFPRSGTRQGCLSPSLKFKYIPGVLAKASRQNK